MTGPVHAPTQRRAAVRAAVGPTLDSSGRSLPRSVQIDMERRFDTDFSRVRVHTDAAATASAAAVGARAYTVGQHVAFAPSQFAPETAKGKALLAHELAHTVQQRGAPSSAGPEETTRRGDTTERAAHQAASQALAGQPPRIAPTNRAVVAREEGTAEIVDTVEWMHDDALLDPFAHGDHAFSQYRGLVRRDEYLNHDYAQRPTARPKPVGNEFEDKAAGRMDTGYVKLEFDSRTGVITIPVTVKVQGAQPGQKLDPTARDFIAEANHGLNGWFALELPACRGVPFSGRTLPIRVEVRPTDATPDFEIAVTKSSERSSVSGRSRAQIDDPKAKRPRVQLNTGKDFDHMTLRHEAAHMALGVPDEYAEPDPKLRKEFPLQKNEARVMAGPDLMSHQDLYGERWSLLYERHFKVAEIFMRGVLEKMGHPECVPALRALRQPPVSIRPSMSEGYSSAAGGSLYVSVGVDAGWSLDRRLQWEAFLGAHAELLLNPSAGSAFLLGARAGLEHRWNPGGTGLRVGAFGEVGAAGSNTQSTAPYTGVGASAGVEGWLGGGVRGQAGLEAMGTVRLDPAHDEAYQLGLKLALTW